jgi:beta-xylosidase
LGLCQWLHFADHRLDDAVYWMRRLGVKYVRTGLSWADRLRPQALEWFDRQMHALMEFEVTLTFCFTPESHGVLPHYTSPPQRIEDFTEFCVEMVRRYASAPAAQPLVSRAAALSPLQSGEGTGADCWPLPSDRPDVAEPAQQHPAPASPAAVESM